MRQSWRWYGPEAGIPLDTIRQAGATEVVSALHEIPIGVAWTSKEVAIHKELIETTPPGMTPLKWSVVESIPVPDAIKRNGGTAKAEIAAWIASMEAVAENGIQLICYNFMPVVDWTRTDLNFVTPTGSTAMRFDQDKFAAFDLHILQRKGADKDYSHRDRTKARSTYEAMSRNDIDEITTNIASALPGSTTEPLSIQEFRDKLETYAEIDGAQMRQNLVDFLAIVSPVAESLGVRLALHPDDPPRPLFGLPRIASTEADYTSLFTAIPSRANGMCFCTGSLGVRAENNLPAMARKFASRISFAHLRATRREDDGLSFYESAHLEGDVDMVAVVRVLMEESRKRLPGEAIVFRPDHGQCMLGDLNETGSPGYPAVGRLRGLAELRGIITALETII